MPGLRIHHPTLRATTLLVPHPGDPHTGRRPKDYHVRLDGNGDCIVSETVWMRLEQARAAGFEHGLVFVNVVEKPPTQNWGWVPPDPTYARRHKVIDNVIRELTPPGLHGRTEVHQPSVRTDRPKENGQ